MTDAGRGTGSDGAGTPVRCDGGSGSATSRRLEPANVLPPELPPGLPAGDAGSAERAGDDRRESPTVLHVDDDPEVGALVATFVERADEDVTVLTETDPAAGLERVAEGDVDCVVTDVEMPGMDGLELLHAVEAGRPDLPVFLFSSRSREELAKGADRAAGYVRKDGDPEQFQVLARQVGSALE